MLSGFFQGKLTKHTQKYMKTKKALKSYSAVKKKKERKDED